MAYNLGDLVSAAQDDLKDSTFSASRLRRYLNEAQHRVFNIHTFKFTQRAVSGALTVGVYTYEQQDDHESTIGGALLHPDDDHIVLVIDRDNYLSHEQFFERYPAPEHKAAGIPKWWTEFGDQFYFDRPVDDDYILTQRYYRHPTDMSDDLDVPDVPANFRSLLEMFALFKAEKYRGNHDVAATYKQEFEDDLEAMVMRYGKGISGGLPKVVEYRRRVGDD